MRLVDDDLRKQRWDGRGGGHTLSAWRSDGEAGCMLLEARCDTTPDVRFSLRDAPMCPGKVAPERVPAIADRRRISALVDPWACESIEDFLQPRPNASDG